MSIKINTPVEVIWEDAQCRDMGPWVDTQKWKYKPLIVHSIGYILYNGKEGILITNSHHSGSTGAVDQIPRKMIRSINKLK